MKVADYVASWLTGVNRRVYAVCGAGAMHLNDAICNKPGLRVTAMHHEQAATFAAEADARVSGEVGVVHVTAGPGGTNTITGLASAFVDSIPLIVIAGQVTSSTMAQPGLRQLGMNELNLVDMVKPVTKYAVTVTDPSTVTFHLNKALALATSGRKGPVWVEFPLDVQAAEMGPQVGWLGDMQRPRQNLSADTREVRAWLRQASRPVLVIGNGVRLANACEEITALVDRLGIPVISSWTASDIIPTDHPCYLGRMGLFGDRASNMAVQASDLVIAIGTRLSVPQIGHTAELFAPKARKIVVDVDAEELRKPTLRPDLAICADAKDFLAQLLEEGVAINPTHVGWLENCRTWSNRYPIMQPEYRLAQDGVNSYYFADLLSRHLPDDAIVVTDVGFGFLTVMQTMRLRKGQRLFHSGGVSSMGYGLPASIGACIAGGGRSTYCISGDGGMMFNLQELQTIADNLLPIKLFVVANNGYKTMQITQGNHFSREAISSPESGLACPDFVKVAEAIGIPAWNMHSNDEAEQWMEHVISRPHPMLCQIHLSRSQVIAPRVQSKVVNGRFVPTPIDHMFPYADALEGAA